MSFPNSNTDGPSFIYSNGNFVITLPDWEALIAKVRELELKVSNLERGNKSE